MELRGMMEAHEEDGAALATFFCWFEKQLLANATAAAYEQQQPPHGEEECTLTEFTLKEAVDAAREATVSSAKGTCFTLPSMRRRGSAEIATAAADNSRCARNMARGASVVVAALSVSAAHELISRVFLVLLLFLVCYVRSAHCFGAPRSHQSPASAPTAPWRTTGRCTPRRGGPRAPVSLCMH